MQKDVLRVLVVDDEKIVLKFLTGLLKYGGMQVKAAESGPLAIALMRQEDFDVVFLDVMMPEMDGVKTLEELKKINPAARYVMMTGYQTDDLLKQAKEAGAGIAIKKPFDLSEIELILDGYNQRKRAQGKMRILIVDDEEVILDFFRRLLDDDTYEVTAVKTGKEALAMIGRREFDVVFLDLLLEDMPGADIYVKIHQEWPQLDIILITGYAKEAEDIVGSKAIQGCLYKPFEIDKIFAVIKKIKEEKGL